MILGSYDEPGAPETSQAEASDAVEPSVEPAIGAGEALVPDEDSDFIVLDAVADEPASDADEASDADDSAPADEPDRTATTTPTPIVWRPTPAKGRRC